MTKPHMNFWRLQDWMNVRTMEQQWSSVQPLLTVLLAIVLLLFAVTKKSKDRRWPPGPTPWPVVGSIQMLGTHPHQSLLKLAKEYGPLMSMKLGSVNVVVVSSPTMAEEFLKTHDRIWASRHATVAGKLMCYGGMDIAFSEYGPRWRYAKKVFQLELFTAKRLSAFQNTRKQEILKGIFEAIEGSCNGAKAFRMDLVLRKTATNIMTKMLMNQSILSEKASAIKDTDDFQETIKDAFRLFGVFYLGDYIPWLDRLDPQRLKKQMYATSEKYDKFLQTVLDEHTVKLEAAKHHPEARGSTGEMPQDIVDTLLTRPRDVDGQYLTELEMKAIMQDVILAGTDTSSTTTEWGLSEMLKNPHCLEKAQAEMDSVVGRDRLVEESDLPNLPYLNAIVKETFRLHPVAPLMVPHVSTEDCEIQGYKIPAKTRLFVNTYAIQRDPAVYDRALEFYPERFLGSEKDVHGLDFDLLPFGTGRRICPGKAQGLVVVQYSMALLIQTCNWSLPGNLKPEQLDMEEVFGMTVPRFNPLVAIASPRLPENVLRGSKSDNQSPVFMPCQPT